MQFATLSTKDGLNAALAALLGDLLEKEVVEAVMVPTRQPHKRAVMQCLIADRAELSAIDPFAPVVPTSAAKQVAALTHRPAGRPLAVVLRSCELRGVIELAKLHQSNLDDLLIIGVDCYGRFENTAFLALAEGDQTLTQTFLKGAGSGRGTAVEGVEITNACRACDYPVPENVDLRLCVMGADAAQEIWVEAVTDKGREALTSVGRAVADGEPAGRSAAVTQLVEQRLAFKKELFEEFTAKTDSIDGLQEALAGCINCYNCRVACPVCYCRECVFCTDTFRHDGEQYVGWAHKRGLVKLPTDTIFYHLTRMVHMSTLCVGCGQCSSACPNGLPVMELFRTVAQATQQRFEYLPGSRLDEAQPLATFHDEEFGEVTGQVK